MAPKLAIVVLLFLTMGLGVAGISLVSSSEGSRCHMSAPLVYTWVTAAVLGTRAQQEKRGRLLDEAAGTRH
eukprot:757689-Prymnesium_polylepis.1